VQLWRKVRLELYDMYRIWVGFPNLLVVQALPPKFQQLLGQKIHQQHNAVVAMLSLMWLVSFSGM
jgi:hypothetical protein